MFERSCKNRDNRPEKVASAAECNCRIVTGHKFPATWLSLSLLHVKIKLNVSKFIVTTARLFRQQIYYIPDPKVSLSRGDRLSGLFFERYNASRRLISRNSQLPRISLSSNSPRFPDEIARQYFLCPGECIAPLRSVQSQQNYECNSPYCRFAALADLYRGSFTEWSWYKWPPRDRFYLTTSVLFCGCAFLNY